MLMKRTLPFALLFALLTSATYAASQQAAAVYTFTCTGSAFQRNGACPDGGRPDGLIQGSGGTFYGVAQDSGEGTSSPTGGTVFSVTPSGTFRLLHTFLPGANNDYANGNLPGGLLQGPDGKLYGQTLFGAVDGCNGYCGYGLLYRVNTDGSGFRILHKFCSQTNCADGASGAVEALGTDGNLYGTTYYGGTGSCSGGCGTIFRVTPSTGAYEVVFNFNVTTSGASPSGLILAPDGTFYGSVSISPEGELLFHYTESTGELTAVPVNFPLVNGLPSAGNVLAFGPNGNLFGLYGIYGESGVGLFEVEPDGSNLQLFPFYDTIDGGGSPQGMMLASDGNFWIPNYNGSSGYGDIISVSPADGTLIQTLTPFSSSAAVGAYPLLLMQAKDGLLWGTTDQYGKSSKGHFADGTVFSLNAGLPPQ